MDLKPYGLNWEIDPANKKSVIPSDFLTRISLAKYNSGNKEYNINRLDGITRIYTKSTYLGKGTFGEVNECITETGEVYIVKNIDLTKTGVDLKDAIIETIIQIIVADETKNSSYPELDIVGPFAPFVIDIGYDIKNKYCYVISQKMYKTVRQLTTTWSLTVDPHVGKKMAHILIRINKVLEELYIKLNFNHRDFKSDNCMYIRNSRGNFMPRIIDFGFSCINYKGLVISGGENMRFRYCNLVGRDMAQLLYETVKYNPWLPNSFKNVVRTLLTYKKGGKILSLLSHIKIWSNTYSVLNSSQEAVNCDSKVIHGVLTAYIKDSKWRDKLIFNPLKYNVKEKPKAKPESEPCPKEKPDYNPKTKRCVKSCPPDKQRNIKTFKCIKKTLKPCPKEKPDYNPKTKRCLKSCPLDKQRNIKTFKCIKKTVAVKPCPKEKPDYNPKTKRCLKSCPVDKQRNIKTFKCIKK